MTGGISIDAVPQTMKPQDLLVIGHFDDIPRINLHRIDACGYYTKEFTGAVSPEWWLSLAEFGVQTSPGIFND